LESLFELYFPIFCRKLTDTKTRGMYWSRLFAVTERQREREREQKCGSLKEGQTDRQTLGVTFIVFTVT